MQLKGYIITLILGLIGFIASLFTINYLSIGKLNVDAEIYVIADTLLVDNKQDVLLVHDTLKVKSPIKILNKKEKAKPLVRSKNKSVTVKQISFGYRSPYMVWVFVISIGTGFALAFLPFLSFMLRKLSKGVSRSVFRKAMALAFVSALLVLLLAQTSAEGNIYRITDLIEHLGILFVSPTNTLMVVTIILLLPNLLSIGGAFVIMAQILKKEAKLTYEELLRLNRKFAYFMVISSIFLVFGVLSSTFLRLSVLHYLPTDYYFLYPKEFVLTYSLIFTFFMIIYYLPGELLIRDRIANIEAEMSTEEIEQYEHLGGHFSLYKVSISLLAPLLSSMVLEGVSNII